MKRRKIRNERQGRKNVKDEKEVDIQKSNISGMHKRS